MADEIVTTDSVVITAPGTALDLANSFDLAEYNALRGFLLYMQDMGVRAWMLRQIALSIYPNVTVEPSREDKTAIEIFDDAVRDLVRSSEFISLEDGLEFITSLAGALLGASTSTEPRARQKAPQFDLRRVASGAVSLKILWDYTQGLPLYVLPMSCRPSRTTVERCLEVFHIIYAEKLAKQARGGGE